MLRITGNEKAVMGGLIAGLATIIVQLQQSGQLTLHEVLVSLGAYVFTHLSVWVTTNTKPPVAPPVV